ncbi:hypothetical protein [Flavobacterium sp. NRK1]|uniref:hypothetical protein n=1 Tax=Flavobacterium sp. NRK1 TaxID=2954929 RepID=UPI0020936948|nr:hypothetical protein [Flavobacterium sp. NRK1]MCO6147930.1 hypothetical protein [Flavobacterium sp. NRK1]
MKNIFYLFLIVLSPLYAQQSGKSVLEKVKAQYASNKFIQFSSIYNLYKNHDAKTIYQSHKGEYLKNPDNEVYLKISSTEYYLNNKVSTQINHDERMIFITNPGKINKDEFNIDELLKSFRVSDFKDKKMFWEIELLAKQGSQLPYGRIILTIGKDFYIQKQVFYYSTTLNFSKDYSKPDEKTPRLEIVYGKHSNAAIPRAKFEASKYYTIVSNKVKLSSKYINYEVVDQR